MQQPIGAAFLLDWIAFLVFLAVLLGLSALPYVFGPVLIKFTHRSRANPRLVVFDPAVNPPPPDVWFFFGGTIQQLQPLGFHLAASVYMPDQVPGVTAVLVLLEHREAQDAAMAAVMYASSESVVGTTTQIRAQHVEIATEFVDGTEIATNNSDQESAFAPVPHKTVLRLPGVKDAARLYRVHQRAIPELARAVKKPLPPSEGMVEELRRGIIKEMSDQIGTGFLHLDDAREYFLPTWKGAFLMCWKLLWPVSWIRRVLRRRREREYLRRWETPGPF